MEMELPSNIRMGPFAFALAAFAAVSSACATGSAGRSAPGREPITVRVENQSSRVVTVDRILATVGSAGSTSFGNELRQNDRPVTRRIGLVNGKSERTLTVPWHPSQLAQEILWLEGVVRIASDTETFGPGRHHSTYQVEECRSQGANSCVVTSSLHLPPGADVTLVIDWRHEARMYYRTPAEAAGGPTKPIPPRRH